MDCEAKMNANGRYRPDVFNLGGSLSALTHDVIELSELQVDLLRLDLAKSSRRARRCLIFTVVGACLLLASLPVSLFAIAETLVENVGWSRAAAFAAAAAIGLTLGALFAAGAYAMLRNGIISLQRSREELSSNLKWIKSALRNREQRRAAAVGER
jgi:hypothetical protein